MKKATLVLFLIINCSLFIINSLNAQDVDKAFEYFDAGNYEQAATQFENALPSIEEEYGYNDTSYYSIIILYTAVSYERVLSYKKAEEYYLLGISVYKSNRNGTENSIYATFLNNLASLYQNMGNYQKAEPLYIEAKNIRERVLGTEHPDYAQSCNNIALLYQSMDNYQKAEPLYKEAKNIREKIFGKEHPDYAQSCNNLALLYSTMGNYQKAEPLYIEAKKIYEKVLGEEHPDYATTCNNLAGLYQAIGNYRKAESLLIEAKKIIEKVLGKEHADYATSCNNLAVLYRVMGNYKKAEPLLIEAKNIYEKALGAEHPDYATSCNNLATLYSSMGNYQKAEPLLIDAKNIYEKVLGTEHTSYASTCNFLAGLYSDLGNYQKAEPLYIEAKNIRERVLGTEHPSYATSCNNLALLYQATGNYQKAESLLIKAKKIREKVLGTEHPSYATSCSNLAALYHTMGFYQKAEPLYEEAKKIDAKALGTEHPNYATSCNNLAFLYMEMNNYKKAEPLIIEANQNIEKQVMQSGTFMSEKEREKFLEENINWNYEIFNSFYLDYKKENPRLPGISYNNALLMKGLLLRSGIAMRQAVLNSGDENLINLHNEWMQKGSMLVKLESMPIAERFMDADSLREVVNNLEKSLVQSSNAFERVGTLASTNWEDVQNSLQKNEVAIEFTHFNYYNNKGWTDSTYYCALILRKGMKQPEMVYLFEEQQLKDILEPADYVLCEEDNIIDLYQVYGSATKSDSLYNLIWKPLEPHLQGIETVNMSLSGLLLTIPFHAIPVNNSDTLLMDIYKLNYLSTTANIVMNTQFYKKDIQKTVLFGGIDYMADTTLWKKTAQKYSELPALTTSRSFQQNLEDFEYKKRGGYEMWTYLKGTLKETELIYELMEKYKIPTEFFTKIEASEEVFKNLSNNSPDILHIATHGFYFPEVEKDYEHFKDISKINYIHSENPLVRSGLIFAGANHTWNGNEIQGIDDGTLSAYEVSHLNFFDCHLVVLSACQTGLGAVNGSEGIYGLQRGFKMSGVDFLIYSLWSVDDYATQLFMTIFYNNLFSGMEIRKAFEEAQTYLRTKTNKVQYWAPFVLVY